MGLESQGIGGGENCCRGGVIGFMDKVVLSKAWGTQKSYMGLIWEQETELFKTWERNRGATQNEGT